MTFRNNLIDIDKAQSNVIEFLRFPLIVCVVLIHANFAEGGVVINGVTVFDVNSNNFFMTFSYLISSVISSIAVPLFFFISGFLFFYKCDSFSGQTYLGKLKKRVSTILFPYIFWNALVLVFYLVSQLTMPQLFSGNFKMVADYSLSDWLWSFWNTQMINENALNAPICVQFWFLRDLMVMAVLTPVIYFFTKKLGVFFVIILAILSFCGLISIHFSAAIYFTLGAFFSIKKINFLSITKKVFPYSGFLYLVIVFVLLLLRGEDIQQYFSLLSIFVGIIFVIPLSDYFLQRNMWRSNKFLSSSSFFIYAYHGVVISFIIKLSFKLFAPTTQLGFWCVYLISPLITIVVGLITYKIILKISPKFAAFITGNRAINAERSNI